MKNFTGEDGREWIATALEEDSPRHHGRWYLVLHPAGDEPHHLMLAEVRWQNRMTAERSIRAMSVFELRRRLRMAALRQDTPGAARNPFGQWKAGGPGTKGGTAAG